MSIENSLELNPGFPLPNMATIPNPTPLKYGTHYVLQLKGVTLARHEHPADTAHWTVVTKGRMKLTEWRTENGVEVARTRVIRDGDLVDLGTDPHEFEALVDGCEFVNISKTGVARRRVCGVDIDGEVAKAKTALQGALAALETASAG
jgi:hypothetical protein